VAFVNFDDATGSGISLPNFVKYQSDISDVIICQYIICVYVIQRLADTAMTQPLFPKKYLPKSLTRRDAKKYAKELSRSRKAYKKGKYITRKKVSSYKHKTSKHILRARRIYKIDDIVPSRELAKKTMCSVKALKQIVRKGEGAYYSSGSRPNQTAHSWGYARLASAVSGGKSAAVDWHIIRDGCDPRGKAYKLAKKAKAKHGRGTRRVPKRRV